MEELVSTACYALLAVAPVLFILLWFVEAPYGKFASTVKHVSMGITLCCPSHVKGSDIRQDLLKHLKDQQGCTCLRAYLKEILAEENIDFYLELRSLESTEDIESQASSIWATYLAPSSLTPINVSAVQLRGPAELANKKEWTKNMYNDMQKAIVTLLLSNAWNRYLESSYYAEYLSTAVAKSSFDARIGWILMESPSFLVGGYCFFVVGDYDHQSNPYNLVVFSLYMFHYFNRSFIYPIGITGTRQSLPLYIMVLGFLNNIASGFIQGAYLGRLAPVVSTDEFFSYHFICGLSLFIFGWLVNNNSDNILKGLRKPGEAGYKIPYGGAYNYVTAANYFGEIVEWIGYALVQWGLPGFVLVLLTFCNLAPRARKYHDWYHENFKTYPRNRKILIPFIW